MRYNKDVMKKLKLYVDTSVINFALAKDIAIDDRDIIRKLCEQIRQGKYEGYISEVVIREIVNTPDETKRKELLDFINTLEFEEPFVLTTEATMLADKYISEKIIPPAHKDDALHIALTTTNDLDVLVTWNFQHLVKYRTRMAVSGINAFMGYKTIDICTPREVVEDV